MSNDGKQVNNSGMVLLRRAFLTLNGGGSLDKSKVYENNKEQVICLWKIKEKKGNDKEG